MGKLFLLFVLVPLAELALLLEIGKRVGTLPTVGLIVVTGLLGAYLARLQGLGVLRRMREETAAGRIPAGSVVDGVLILVAGALLMTPGVLTDAFGFFCLVPAGRRFLKERLRRWFERAVRSGKVKVSVNFAGFTGAPRIRRERDVTPRTERREPNRLPDETEPR